MKALDSEQRPKRIDEVHMRGPALDLPVMAVPDVLDRAPGTGRRNQGQRSSVGFPGHLLESSFLGGQADDEKTAWWEAVEITPQGIWFSESWTLRLSPRMLKRHEGTISLGPGR